MRAIRVLAMGAAAAALVAFMPGVASAQVRLTTPYPDVAVEPGQTVTFDLRATSPVRERVDLSVIQRPEGWRTTLRGGGFVIDGVFAAPSPPDVQLEVRVPGEAEAGTYPIVVTASSASGSDALELALRVARAVGGGVTLTTDFPSLQGPADVTYTFEVTLENNTPQESTFTLETAAPEGWQIDARPAGQERAATVTVAGGGTSSITVEADPPDEVVAGSYTIGLRAVGSGREATAELNVDITGNFALRLTMPGERLNAEVVAGRSTELTVLLVNEGTAPLRGVRLSATPPAGWNVDFAPEAIEQIAPGAAARAQATLRPSGDAVAGDYVVTLRADAPEVSEEIEVRTTVKTSGVWGFVGIVLIVAAVWGLAWVYRRYGRR